jgi:hypothetical protein
VDSEIFLAGTKTCASSAIAGRILSSREVL